MSAVNVVHSSPVSCGGRMVVFVPGMLENLAEFARQVYIQAAVQHRAVLFLALKNQAADPLAASRQLATITALTQDSEVPANALQVNGADSVEALREFAHPGDLVVWTEERLLAPTSLEHELGITQQVLPASYTSAGTLVVPWLRAAFFWLTGLIILAVFTYLEFRLHGIASGASRKLALIGVFSLELAAFHLWSQKFG